MLNFKNNQAVASFNFEGEMEFFRFVPSKTDKRYLKAIFEEHKRTDAYMLRVLFLGFCIGFVLALFLDKFSAWLIFGIYPLVVFSASFYYRSGSLLTRIIAAFCLVSESYMMFAIGEGSEFRSIFMVLPFIMSVRYRDWVTMLALPLSIAVFETFFHTTYHFLDFKWVLDYIDPFSFKRQFAGYGIMFAAFLFCMRINYIFGKMTEKAIFDRINLHERLRNLQENLLFAKELVKENYEYDFVIKGVNPLGEALIELRESLKASRQAARESAFKSESLALLSATLREKAGNLEELCAETLKDMGRVLNFQLGIFFVADFEEKKLQPKAAYGVELKSLPASNFEEGLSGQAFKSGKIIHLKKLPETYIKVKSALGSSNRANLILIPLKNAGSPIGLLEIIAFQDFKQYEIDFIETVSEIIGSVVDSSISLSKSTRHRK